MATDAAHPPDTGAPQILLVDCPDRPGLIHAITGVLYRHGANIVSNDEFVERELNWFFMRAAYSGIADTDALLQELRTNLPERATVRVARPGAHRIVVLVTREHHCVGELLLRHAYDELGASIEAVVSNHAVLEPLVRRFDVPFHVVPHEGMTREAHESAVLNVIEPYRPDYLVLAKYMRILSPAFVTRFAHRIVNIHHSFLPAFVGSNPYRQAFERGVKIIGATAHFVTANLDEGPIIAQAIEPVDHSYRAEDMARAGRDVEKIVLAKALKLVFEDKIFLSGNRTVIFE